MAAIESSSVLSSDKGSFCRESFDSISYALLAERPRHAVGDSDCHVDLVRRMAITSRFLDVVCRSAHVGKRGPFPRRYGRT